MSEAESRTTAVGVRPAVAADSEFCYQLHKATLGEYVTVIWGWDEQAQRDFHARAFDPIRCQIITVMATTSACSPSSAG